MNKNAIQKYAIWARNELRNQVTQRAFQYGITPEERPEKGLASVNGIMLTPIEQKQRDQLVEEVWRKGFNQVIEELAYTWFNRLIAIRFMEVNDYLPEGVRVLSNSKNEFRPEILSSALSLDKDHFKKDLILRLIDEGKQEELYRYLLLAECNALNEILPVMFEKMDGYTELMLPPNLLKSDSIIGKLISDIDESDWRNQIEIIGWLYQYYILEKREDVINALSRTVIRTEDIPAATQLFTTEWVAQYMVENSLGRYWIENNVDSKISLQYLIPKAEEIKTEKKPIEEVTFLDPCMGSGQILINAFDLFLKIYREHGYKDREAVKNIIEKNLFGIEIDPRCYQLAYFSLMMKARSVDRRFLTRKLQPHVICLDESLEISPYTLQQYIKDEKMKNIVDDILIDFKKAKYAGSLICPKNNDYKGLINYLDGMYSTQNFYDLFEIESIKKMAIQADYLSSLYTVVCTNPPYLNRVDADLKKFLNENYKDYSTDVFSAFIYRNTLLTQPNGYSAYMSPYVWMFIKSYLPLRKYILNTKQISTIIQFEYSAYDEATVPICTFVLKNTDLRGETKGIKLSQFKGGMEIQRQKTLEAIENPDCSYCFTCDQNKLKKIPGSPIAFWATENIFNVFSTADLLGDVAKPRQGMATTNNNRFLRYWYEVEPTKIGFNLTSIEETIGPKKWFPYNKGGDFRKWYGNNDYVVNFKDKGKEVCDYIDRTSKVNSKGRVINREFYFKESVSWSLISSSAIAFRYKEPGFIFDVAGMSCFAEHDDLLYLLGLCNSTVVAEIMSILAPTINYQVGDIANIPVLMNEDVKDRIVPLVQENITLEKEEWDNYEISWNFSRHPLVPNPNSLKSCLIRELFSKWKMRTEENYNRILKNEQDINLAFKNLYGFDNSFEKTDSINITYRKADYKEDIKGLISYFVGNAFGRFNVYKDGFQNTNDLQLNSQSIIDPDNIIPVGEDEYFEDDLTARFIDWIKIVYGEENIEENLQFIANALGGKGSSREVIRKYFLNDFFTDHCKTYKKRPIYWLFDSGKKNGFKCLIYMHRYQPDTIARIRTDYVHEQQERYRSQIKHIEDTIDDAPKSEQVKMRKQLKDLTGKLDEVTKYEEKIHHLADQMIKIDLDDGVKHNYAIFQDVLAKIK